MRLFQKRRDDFAEIACDPQRRQAALVDLARQRRTIGLTGFLFALITVVMAFDQNVGAVCGGVMAALMFSVNARLEADTHLLQTLEKMARKHET